VRLRAGTEEEVVLTARMMTTAAWQAGSHGEREGDGAGWTPLTEPAASTMGRGTRVLVCLVTETDFHP